MKIETPNQASPNAVTSGLFHGLVLLAACSFFFYGATFQTQNWDMLGYVASVLSLSNEAPSDIHGSVYEGLRHYVSADEFESLTQNHSYREAMYADPELFLKQVPYYKIRVVYVGAIYLLASVGVNLYLAAHLIAAFSAALGFVVFFYAFKRVTDYTTWPVIPIFFILCGGLDVGQVASPDSLAFLSFGLISFSLIRKHWSVFPLLVLSVFIRTDMIVLVALALSYFAIFRPDLRIQTAVTAVVAAVCYVGLNSWADNYGWSTVFHYVFVSDMLGTDPEHLSRLGVTPQQYVSAFVNGVRETSYSREFWLFLSHCILQIAIFWKLQANDASTQKWWSAAADDPVALLTVLSIAYVIAHFFLFPGMWSRFFVGQYMAAGLGLLYMLTRLTEAAKSRRLSSKKP